MAAYPNREHYCMPASYIRVEGGRAVLYHYDRRQLFVDTYRAMPTTLMELLDIAISVGYDIGDKVFIAETQQWFPINVLKQLE